MIWIETQKGELYYCSAIKIIQITASQYVMRDQYNDELAEYNSIERALEIKDRIKDFIRGTENHNNIFKMPQKFE